jgi:hypothetical protein
VEEGGGKWKEVEMEVEVEWTARVRVEVPRVEVDRLYNNYKQENRLFSIFGYLSLLRDIDLSILLAGAFWICRIFKLSRLPMAQIRGLIIGTSYLIFL